MSEPIQYAVVTFARPSGGLHVQRCRWHGYGDRVSSLIPRAVKAARRRRVDVGCALEIRAGERVLFRYVVDAARGM